MPQENPPLLDKTMNTTEQIPRNLADVLASGLANIANNVKPDGSDISIDVPGMSATNVNDGFSELKGTLTELTTITPITVTAYDSKTTIDSPTQVIQVGKIVVCNIGIKLNGTFAYQDVLLKGFPVPTVEQYVKCTGGAYDAGFRLKTNGNFVISQIVTESNKLIYFSFCYVTNS